MVDSTDNLDHNKKFFIEQYLMLISKIYEDCVANLSAIDGNVADFQNDDMLETVSDLKNKVKSIGVELEKIRSGEGDVDAVLAQRDAVLNLELRVNTVNKYILKKNQKSENNTEVNDKVLRLENDLKQKNEWFDE